MRKQTDQDKYCDLVIRIGVCQRISVYDEKQGVLKTFYILFFPGISTQFNDKLFGI